MIGWLAAMTATAALVLAGATTAAHDAQQQTPQTPQTQQTSQPSQPAQSAQSAQPTARQAAGSGYLGDIFGGGTSNGCNFASGYQAGDCNPAGETEQQYINDPGGPAPGTKTNSQGCYYVKMDTGYCPSTGQYIPMPDPNK